MSMQVPDGALEDVGEQRPRVVRAVQRGRDEPVAVVEVGLPVDGVVLVGPRHVPDRGARHRDRAGSRARRARRPYSASSHLMNSGSGRPTSSATARGIRHIHQPL